VADDTTTIEQLKAAARAFAAERDWDPYHSPKNLALALAGEIGELAAEFRWLTEAESRSHLLDPAFQGRVADELADVLNLLLLMASHCGIDLSVAAAAKRVKAAVKYPAPAKA
jgi:NTP pyrophosphatase (non-canonical NTP hydrolase)